MAKYLIETYYTCSFKVSHYLDDISENEISKLEKRDDGKFDILDIKLDNRKTKNLDGKNKSLSKTQSTNEQDLKKDIQKPKIIPKENNQGFVNKINEGVGKRFSMPDRRKGYIQKATKNSRQKRKSRNNFRFEYC